MFAIKCLLQIIIHSIILIFEPYTYPYLRVIVKWRLVKNIDKLFYYLKTKI